MPVCPELLRPVQAWGGGRGVRSGAAESGARVQRGTRVEQSVQLGGLPGKRGRCRRGTAGELRRSRPATGEQQDQGKPGSPPDCRAVPPRAARPVRRGARRAGASRTPGPGRAAWPARYAPCARPGRAAWPARYAPCARPGSADRPARSARLRWQTPALLGPDQPRSPVPALCGFLARPVLRLSGWLAPAFRSRLPSRRADLLGRPVFLRTATWGFMHVVHDSEAAAEVWDAGQQILGAGCERPQDLPQTGHYVRPGSGYVRRFRDAATCALARGCRGDPVQSAGPAASARTGQACCCGRIPLAPAEPGTSHRTR